VSFALDIPVPGYLFFKTVFQELILFSSTRSADPSVIHDIFIIGIDVG